MYISKYIHVFLSCTTGLLRVWMEEVMQSLCHQQYGSKLNTACWSGVNNYQLYGSYNPYSLLHIPSDSTIGPHTHLQAFL